MLRTFLIAAVVLVAVACGGVAEPTPGPTPHGDIVMPPLKPTPEPTPEPSPTPLPSVLVTAAPSDCPPQPETMSVCKGCCGDSHVETVYADGTSGSYGGPRLAHQVRDADAVIVGTLVSVVPGTIRGQADYETGFLFTFDVSEYLKGSGKPRVRVVSDYCIGGASHKSLTTSDEAISLTCPLLVDRDTELDRFERVVFLYGYREDTDAYYGGFLSFHDNRQQGFGVKSNNFPVVVYYNYYIIQDDAIYYPIEHRSVPLSEIRALVRDGVPETLPPLVKPHCDGPRPDLYSTPAWMVPEELEGRGLELDLAQAFDSLHLDPSGEWVYVLKSYGPQPWGVTARLIMQKDEDGDCIVTDIADLAYEPQR